MYWKYISKVNQNNIHLIKWKYISTFCLPSPWIWNTRHYDTIILWNRTMVNAITSARWVCFKTQPKIRTWAPWDFAMLKLGPWDPWTCNQVPENWHIFLVPWDYQLTLTINCIDFNCEANLDNKKLGLVSPKVRGSSRWTKIFYQNISIFST